jgi:hypothetical protein
MFVVTEGEENKSQEALEDVHRSVLLGSVLWIRRRIRIVRPLKALTDHLRGGSRLDSFDPQW